MSDHITLDDLKDSLTIEADFTGWSHGDAINKMEIRLLFNGEVIAETDLYVDPAIKSGDVHD